MKPRIIAIAGQAKLAAATQEAGALRRFHMDAYNGGTMAFAWSPDPVVVDLAGMSITDKPRPILKDHESKQVVGHSEKITNTGTALTVDGIVSGTGQAAAEVVANSDRGFPWQASIGCTIDKVEQIAAGVEIVVNGQTFTGPLLIVRASRLGEVSFVALGADDSTLARMTAAADQTNTHQGFAIMDFSAWLKSLGFDEATLSHEQVAALKKAYEADVAAAKAPAAEAPAAAAAARKALLTASAEVNRLEAAKVTKTDPTVSPELKAAREEHASEVKRINAIRKLCAGLTDDTEEKAIGEGWTVEKTEVTVLRASRTSGPAIGRGTPELTTGVLEAAIMQAARLPNLERLCSEQVLQAAQTRFKGRLGLQELILEAAWANGYSGRSFKQDMSGVLRAAFGQLNAAGFSTVDTPGILSNVANKFLLDGFMAVDQAWKKIATIKNVSDFKTATSYRMTGISQYDKVGPTGAIKSGTLNDESFTNKADTYAKLFAISRTDLVNDDLGALTTVPKMLGRGAALKLNEVFWTEFLADNSTFYTSGRGNFFVGATSSLLTIDGLTEAERLFLVQVDSDSKPLGIMPKFLIVPPALSVQASLLNKSLEMRNTAAKDLTSNPHAGKYEPIVCPYLSNATIPGFSALSWFLSANPADLSVIEVALLNGAESPTIETADADFSTLGIQMRGYHDFGVRKQDYRAAVKSKGQA
jgi:phage major head subunit gpT-like protein